MKKPSDRKSPHIFYIAEMTCPITPDIDAAVVGLLAGGCVAIPTDTVYGVAARLDDPAAVAHLFALKGRDVNKPIAVLIGSPRSAGDLARIDDRTSAIIEACWPGPLTIVVPRLARLTTDLGGDPANVGLRCPASAVVRALIERVGPLATTSANRSGTPTYQGPDEIARDLGDWLYCVLDGGVLSNAASSVVDLTGSEIVVLREGPITAAELARLT